MPDDDRRCPLNAGSRRMARDPALLYEEAESASCAGCVHVVLVIVAGSEKQACARGKRYGRRCKDYDEAKPVRW